MLAAQLVTTVIFFSVRDKSCDPNSQQKNLRQHVNHPKYADDELCDDESNIAECNWDGGACCNNGLAEWDKYCRECECKGT